MNLTPWPLVALREIQHNRNQTVGTVPRSMTYSVPVIEAARGET
jgi:hypothetical protein